MKIINGFISNSSTTSFCILGTCFKREELKKLLLDNFPDLTEDDVSGYDIAETAGEKVELHSERGEEGDYIYLGVDAEDLTKDKYRTRTIDSISLSMCWKLKKALGVDLEPKQISIMQEAWRDG